MSIFYNHIFFFFNDTATTEIYTLSLHDALPISPGRQKGQDGDRDVLPYTAEGVAHGLVVVAARSWRLPGDRKSTRLNSSHLVISYAVFCLKKKNNKRALAYDDHFNSFCE